MKRRDGVSERKKRECAQELKLRERVPELPWTEKYRCTHLDQMVGIPDHISLLQPRDGPLLFYGPSGTGKTTLAHCLAHDKRNSTKLTSSRYGDVVEINSSEDRSVGLLIPKLQGFVRIKGPKVLILDECESLTHEAQEALRGFIDLYQTTTWFLFTCNSTTHLNRALLSRCSEIYMGPVSKADITTVLSRIARAEGKPENAFSNVAAVTQGDLRHAISTAETSCFVPVQSELLQNINRFLSLLYLSADGPDLKELLLVVDEISSSGVNIAEFLVTLTSQHFHYKYSMKVVETLAMAYAQYYDLDLSSRLQYHGLVCRIYRTLTS